MELTEKQQAEKNLFEMVYNWGASGIVTDYECNAFQKALQELKRLSCVNSQTRNQTS